MVLLDILAKSQPFDKLRARKPKAKSQLVVAHFNHGIRSDSGKDEYLVLKTAKKYNLTVEVGYGHLGAGTSEEKARKARYNFLYSVKEKYQANFIITAHHQNDLLETAALNILRGTGRRGLSAISDNPDVLRPLLGVPKTEIVKYANQNKLKWREDRTNEDDRYLRNYLRNHILNNLTDVQRDKLLKYIDNVAKVSEPANTIIATISHNIKPDKKIDRLKFITLPPEVANELIIYWLVAQKFRGYDKKLVERLCMAIKTALPGTHHNVNANFELMVDKKFAWFNRLA